MVVLPATQGLRKPSTADNRKEEPSYVKEFDVAVFEPMAEEFKKDPRFDASPFPVFDDKSLDEDDEWGEEVPMDDEVMEPEAAVSDQTLEAAKKELPPVPSQNGVQTPTESNAAYNKDVKNSVAPSHPVKIRSSSEKMQLLREELKAFLEESDAKSKKIDE